MRPYFAVIQDSFREAIGSPVLWILLILLTLFLAALAPFGAREEFNTKIEIDDVSDWQEFAKRLDTAAQKTEDSPGKRIWSRIPEGVRESMSQLKPPDPGNFGSIAGFHRTIEKYASAVNDVIEQPDLFDAIAWKDVELDSEADALIEQGVAKLEPAQRSRLHRVAIENAFGDLIRSRPQTSFIFSYAVWDLNPPGPIPLKQERFHDELAVWIAWLSDWIVGLVLVFAAILVTAPIIPRMFDQGQLHLLLSKPVARSFLLIAQFCGGCVYVLLLTSYLIGGLWLILGWRLGYWDVSLLWMIPLYTFMFALYYTVSAATAVVWRSTLMCIIVSILFFITCFSLGFAKVSLEETFLLPQRVKRIVPTKNSMLAVNERGLVSAWNTEKQVWQLTFLPKQLEEVGPAINYLPIQLPSIGPIYLPERDEIVAVQFPLAQRSGPLSFGQQIVVVGSEANDWKHTPGSAAPLGTFAIFREADGRVLAVSNIGVYRLAADPLRKSGPTKIFGVTVPTLGGSNPYVDVSPKDGLALRTPATAAYHAASKSLAVYTPGELKLLRADEQGKYQIVAERKVNSMSIDAALLACDGEHVMVVYRNGRIHLLSMEDFADVEEFQPETASDPRFLHASPVGGHFALAYQNGVLWTFDTATKTWSRPRVSGQGDISGISFNDAGALLVADHTARITTYDPTTFQREARLDPQLDFMQRSYYYVIHPLYTIFPKPGELGKTMKYLATGKDTIEYTNRQDEGISAAQRRLNPWSPVWSGLAFMVVVLTATCIYFERQEY